MNNYQISSKSEAASSQQARNPAPATGNIDTQHTAVAKKLVPFPPVHSESDQATLRLGGQSNDDFHPTTSGETADAKKLAHAPPVHPPDSPGTFRLGSPGRNDDLHPMTAGEKAEAHVPPVHPPEPPGTFRLGDPDNDDFYPMTYRQKNVGPRLVAALWSYSLTLWQARNDSRYNSTTGTFHPEHLSRLDEKISEAYLHPDRVPLALRPTIFSQPLVTRLA